ncbi:MAG: hypothetical protein ACYC6L_06090 [Anaerolineae bacterium]
MEKLRNKRVLYALIAGVVSLAAGALLAGFSAGQRRSRHKNGGANRLLGGL